MILHNIINGNAKGNMVAQVSTIAKSLNPSTELVTIAEGMAAQQGKPAITLLLILHNIINGSAKGNMVAQVSTIAKN